jgi:predicted DNA-binding protein
VIYKVYKFNIRKEVEEMKTFCFALPVQQKRRLIELKRRTGLSFAELLRRAIDEYLHKMEITQPI